MDILFLEIVLPFLATPLEQIPLLRLSKVCEQEITNRLQTSPWTQHPQWKQFVNHPKISGATLFRFRRNFCYQELPNYLRLRLQKVTNLPCLLNSQEMISLSEDEVSKLDPFIMGAQKFEPNTLQAFYCSIHQRQDPITIGFWLALVRYLLPNYPPPSSLQKRYTTWRKRQAATYPSQLPYTTASPKVGWDQRSRQFDQDWCSIGASNTFYEDSGSPHLHIAHRTLENRKYLFQLIRRNQTYHPNRDLVGASDAHNPSIQNDRFNDLSDGLWLSSLQLQKHTIEGYFEAVTPRYGRIKQQGDRIAQLATQPNRYQYDLFVAWLLLSLPQILVSS